MSYSCRGGLIKRDSTREHWCTGHAQGNFLGYVSFLALLLGWIAPLRAFIGGD